MNWDRFNPSEFEQLCFKLLVKEGFINPVVFAGPGDRGRDIVAEYLVPILGNTELLKFLIQCKRIDPKTSISISKISGLKDWMDSHDDYQRALIITTSNVTPDTRDWIEGINIKSKYRIQVWDKAELETRLSSHSELLREHFKTAEILISFKFEPRKIPALDEYKFEPVQFYTARGEVIIVGQVTGSAMISGAYANLSIMLDGKLSGESQLVMANSPTPNNFSLRFDRLSNGPHSIRFSLRNNDSRPQEVVSGEIRLIEIPPGI